MLKIFDAKNHNKYCQNLLRRIPERVITEEEFVNLFATDKQKEKYHSSGNKFISSNKQTVMKQAKRECEIEDIGGREYKITKVYKYPVPKNFDKMNSGIHQYLTPLILMNLIAAKIYEEENITFTCTKWYRMIDLINDNYVNMRRNIDYSSNKLSLGKDVLNDFFDTTDDTLIYYFKKSLEYLKAANLFNYQEIYWLCVREVDKTQDSGTIDVKINKVFRRAEHHEMKYVRRCDQLACIYADIDPDNDTEKFYGKKSHTYLRKYRELLLERNILFCYKAYEIYSTDKDIERCYKLLNTFDIKDKSSLIAKLNAVFQKNIMINAQNRITNRPEKRNLFSKSDMNSFMRDYKKIAKLTLDARINKIDVPKLIGVADIQAINDLIEDDIHVSFNGEKMNVGVDND